jgi:queuine tRNA-ribosyltransferase
MSLDSIKIRGKKYQLPIFLPDATRAVVRGLDSKDLKELGVGGVVVNTYHLMSDPGAEVLEKIGGIKKFTGFDGLVVSDSGGWQIFSTIHRNGGAGKITDEGVIFGFKESASRGKKKIFTPEDSVRMQFEIGSDVIICLDDFTAPDAKNEKIRESVERTILWAERSRKEFDKIIRERKLTDKDRPHLFAVIQGGWDKDLRSFCAKELLKIGFDGYGYGGYTVCEGGGQNLEMAKYVADLIPEEFPKFALGSGKPMDIVRLSELGWDIFDCVLPTRDARHQRLYSFERWPEKVEDLLDEKNHGYLYLNRGRYAADEKPISEKCDCRTCQNFSRSYLHHLFKINDMVAMRLATIHNLRLYTKIIDIIKDSGEGKI